MLMFSSFVEAKSNVIRTVESVDLEKFMGKWYVLYYTPTLFDKYATNGTETYYFDYETSKIDIEYKFNKKSFSGPKKTINQIAKPVQDANSEWQINMLGGLIRIPYYIVDLDSQYNYTVITTKNKKYIWILVRKLSINTDIISKIFSRLESQNYDLKR